MKKYRSLFAVLITGLFIATPLMSQNADAIRKELNSRSPRKARQEAKKLEKDGYKPGGSGLPLEMQLERTWTKVLENDENGNPRYLLGNAISFGETQIAAKIQATEVARLDIATQIASEINELVKTEVANQQLTTEEAASITKTVAAAQTLVAQSLGRVIPSFEAYKKVGTGVEAQIRLLYDQRSAKEDAKKLIRDKLEKETGIAQEKLDALLKK